MFGLPENFDGTFFVGRTLEMICFNINQIYFHFDDHITVQIEGPFTYQRGPLESEASLLHPPVPTSNLMELLEHSGFSTYAAWRSTCGTENDGKHTQRCSLRYRLVQ
jgi:hypothetical protein